MSKIKTQIKLNPNSTYHDILIKKYGRAGALKELQRANLRYVMEHSWLPKMSRIAKVR